jgi:hypothetical protein
MRSCKQARMVVVSAAIAAGMALPFMQSAAAQELLDEHFWITAGSGDEGRVRVIKKTADTLYLGGDFLYVGPISGAGAALRRAAGEPAAPFPNVFGEYPTVYDALPDGEGGWFIAGQFTEVAGVEVTNLARLRSDGSAEALPSPNARVHALALQGTTLYLGGLFTAVDGVPRNRAAAIDISTPAPAHRGGTLLPWNPDVAMGPAPQINDILTTGPGGPVVLAGWFTHVGGVEQPNLAYVDPVSGQLLPGPDANNMLNSLSLLDDTLYVGGHFTQVGGVGRTGVAAVNLQTGAVLPWNPNPNSSIHAAVASPDAVYISGPYTTIGGLTRNRLTSVHPITGAVLPWNPQVSAFSVRVIVPSPEGVYIGGSFSSVNGVPRHRVALVDTQTAQLHPWPVHAADSVRVIQRSHDGDNVFVGGQFRSVGGQPRRHAAAIDLKSGALTDWNPRPNGGILDIWIAEDSAFVVGGFLGIGTPPVTRYYAAEVDLITGQPTAWTPPEFNFPGNRALAVTDDHVYVGGDFSNLGGRVAELHRSTGAWTGRNIGTGGGIGFKVHDLLHDAEANVLYVGGFFTFLAGSLRSNLGAIDLVSGVATAWDPNVGGNRVQAMACKGDVMYLVGTFHSIGGVDRANAGAVLKSTGEVTPWNPALTSGSGVHGTGLAVAVGEDSVYVGGTFTRVNGIVHIHAAAVDGVTGTLLDWDAQPRGPAGAGFVFDLILDQSMLHLAGDFTTMLGEIREGVATVSSLEPPSGPLGDLNGDGVVDVSDLLILLGAWGPCPPSGDCPADLDGDGAVNVSDLLILLGNWGEGRLTRGVRFEGAHS